MKITHALPAALVLLIPAACSSQDGGQGSPAGQPTQAASSPPLVPVPDRTDDGVFRYTITKVRKAASYEDNTCGEPVRAQGEMTVITVRAQSIARSPRQPAAGNDFDESLAWAPDGRSFEEHTDICTDGVGLKVNPGQSASYDLVFEAPKGTRLTVLTLAGHQAQQSAAIPIKE